MLSLYYIYVYLCKDRLIGWGYQTPTTQSTKKEMDKDKQATTHRDIEIDLREEIAQGDYANLAIISHSPTEFVMDFASLLPGMSKPRVSNRIIITPEHAKRLLGSLLDNINRYESSYGNIETPQQQQQEMISKISNSSKLGEA